MAIVTGASSGIGAETARMLAARGHRLVLIARREGLLRELAGRLAPAGGPHEVVALDLDEIDAIGPAMANVLEAQGPAEVLLNAAGAGMYREFLETGREDHERLMRVNYLAVVEMIRAVLPGMQAAGRGHVINVASMSTKVGPWGHSAYAAAKAAVVSLTQTLAAEHGPARGGRIHFSVVNPGIIRTNYFRAPEVAALWPRVEKYAVEPEAAARAIVGLLDRPRLEICVPRHYRFIDLMYAISPAWAHRIVARQSGPE